MECVTSLGGDELLRNELRWRGGEKTGRIRRDPQRVLRSSSQRSRRSRKGSGVLRSRTSVPCVGATERTSAGWTTTQPLDSATRKSWVTLARVNSADELGKSLSEEPSNSGEEVWESKNTDNFGVLASSCSIRFTNS